MNHKMTISNVAYLSDCMLEEGATVYVEDTGKVFRCIQGFGGQLIWELEAKRHYDFPETQVQLQEISHEEPVRERREAPLKMRLVKKVTPTYLH